MDVPIQVSFRHLPYDASLAADIRARATRLLTFHGRILNCHVAVERPHHSHVHGDRYHVRIELAVPGELLIITHEPTPLAVRSGDGGTEDHKSTESAVHHRDVAVTLHEAFDEARRQLEDYVQRRRSACTRERPVPPHDPEDTGETDWPQPTHILSSRVH